MISWLGSQKKLTLVFSSQVLGISSRFIYTGFKARCGCVASIYLYKCSTITNICTKRNLQCKPWLGRLMNHCIKPTPNWGSDYYYYFETIFFVDPAVVIYHSNQHWNIKKKLNWVDWTNWKNVQKLSEKNMIMIWLCKYFGYV